jgi:hypothetical protein
MSDTKNGLSIARAVSPDTSGYEGVEMERDGTVESVSVRIYQGAENTLRLRVLRVRDGSQIQIVQLHGKDWIDGDDDVYRWDVSEPVEQGDEVVVQFDNNDPDHPHNYRVNVDVDHSGGTSRSILGALGVGS